jgi:hypothetical protein
MNRLTRYLLNIIFITIVLQVPARAQIDPDQFWMDAQKVKRIEKSKASQDKMAWWRAARFGMFIHWNMASVVGAEMSWGKDFTGGKSLNNSRPSMGSEERETQRWWDGILPRIPPEVYDHLHKSFYPAMFDAGQWVAMAKEAGMKYIVLVAKHHDGFCLWNSQFTDYDMQSTLFKRDIVAELAKATEKAGLKFGIYYSQRDWSHPDYTAIPAKYIEYMHKQLEELLEKYPQISILFFDAENYPQETWETEKLFKMVGKLRSNIIINNRCGVAGDFDTPEERAGDFPNDRDWEARMTFGGKSSWRGFDTEIISFKEFVSRLVNCAGSDGNLLMNVDPLPTGQIDPRQVERMKEMGEWLRNYGESICGTRGGPILPGRWGASTYKDNVIYLHVLDWSQMPAKLPGFGMKIISDTLLTGGQVEVRQMKDSLRIHVAEEFRNKIDTIIKLQLHGPVSEIEFFGIDPPVKTANPEASPKARDLLGYLYSISGKKTLTGQHNFIGRMSQSTDRVAEITGKYPAIWGSDFGFADSTWDHDNIKYRAFIVDEIKKQYSNGSIITLTYHQANPKIGEPCPWIGGVNGTKLSSAEWDSLLTPGTGLHLAWKKQMDIIATYLKELRDADVPILWRPYHEMNGGWFWWGAKKEPNGFITFWRMLFDYYTNHHQLNNLIWVWSPDKPWHGLEEYYPGDAYVDVISVDIYPHRGYPVVFRQEWYERVRQLAKGKPVAIGENGSLPVSEELNTQPKWVWFMSWADLLERQNSKADILNLYNAYHTLTRDEIRIEKR